MKESLSSDRSENGFSDYKPALTAAQAQAEAHRCLYCSDAPCIQACPTEINVPEFIRKIGTGNVKGSARTIFEANILGMSCARVCPVETLCAGACVYNAMGSEPVQIGKLQRFSTDRAYQEGWRFFEAGPDSGKSVGLIGAGPASLAAAHELRRHGHRCTLYEQRDVIGGLNTTGVAPHKMKADRGLQEAQWVLGIGGIEVKSSCQVGKDLSLAELEKAHQAVFVGVGLGEDTRLSVPGEDLPGVHGAVAWVEQLKLGRVVTEGVRSCLVIGGGNTAMDAVREALSLGIPSVTLVYRGRPQAMPGYLHEWEAAKLAGARAEWQLSPVAFEGQGKVERVVFTRVDAAKKPLPQSELSLSADLVLLAIGQSKLGAMLSSLPGIGLDHGRIVTDAHGFTGRTGWYAGGDCRNGGKEVVNAAAEGKAAALAIHAFLSGVTLA